MVNKKLFLKLLSTLVCLVLITAIALTVTGCQKTKTPEAPEITASAAAEQKVKFALAVVDGEGNSKSFEIETAEKTVGAALLKEGLIEGENGQYGLYIKKVNGITADFDKDGTYWAFYVNGEYAAAGVDATDIVAGATYTLKVEK